MNRLVFFFAVFSIVGIRITTHPPRVDAVSRWSVHEITLISSQTYANPYTQVTLTATFQEPGGVTKTVKGFWDGGNTFKIRFTPTAIGTWSYATASVPSDSGLTTNGTLPVTSPSLQQHGFVRRDPDTPYYWKYDDGSRYFMLGTTYYGIIDNALAGNNWQTSIDTIGQYGITKVRMLLYTWPNTAFNYPDKQPFFGDHDTLNVSYWQKFDEIITYLAGKNLTADMVLFADADRVYGTQAQDERYVRYALARYAAYPNVVWCLTNEWNYTNKLQNYWDGIGGIVKNEDPWLNQNGALRPLSVHQQTRKDFQFFGSSWPTHAIVQLGTRSGISNGDDWGNQSIMYNRGHSMPVVNDEWGYMGENGNVSRMKHRQISWGIYTAGGSGATGDAYDGNQANFWTGDWDTRDEYSDLKVLSDFWTAKGIAYWKMTPQNDLVTSGTRVYVLAESGKTYVIYAAVGGSFAFNLPSGTYRVTQYDPRMGISTPLSDLPNGGVRQLTAPDANDWVFLLTSYSGEVTPSVNPTVTTPSGCPRKPQGDATCDGRITLADFEMFRREFTGIISTMQADFSGDGRVSLADFEIWRQSFMAGP